MVSIETRKSGAGPFGQIMRLSIEHWKLGSAPPTTNAGHPVGSSRQPKPKPGAEPNNMVFDGILKARVVLYAPGGIAIGRTFLDPLSIAVCKASVSSTAPLPMALKSPLRSYQPLRRSFCKAVSVAACARLAGVMLAIAPPPAAN